MPTYSNRHTAANLRATAIMFEQWPDWFPAPIIFIDKIGLADIKFDANETLGRAIINHLGGFWKVYTYPDQTIADTYLGSQRGTGTCITVTVDAHIPDLAGDSAA